MPNVAIVVVLRSASSPSASSSIWGTVNGPKTKGLMKYKVFCCHNKFAKYIIYKRG